MKIILYNGKGVDFFGLKQWVKLLKYFSLKFELSSKISSFDLLIMPGGIETAYYHELKNEYYNILNKIEKGASYLGVCAGAYFATFEYEFAKNTNLELIKARGLNLINIKAVGPFYNNNYDYNSIKWAYALKTIYKNQEINLYYNGGCCFDNIPSQVQSLMQCFNIYGDLKDVCIKFKYGKGSVVLSGMHFEYSLSLNSEISEKLNKTNDLRLNLCKDVFNFLINN